MLLVYLTPNQKQISFRISNERVAITKEIIII